MRHREIEHARRVTREIIGREGNVLIDTHEVLFKDGSKERLFVLEVDVDQVLVENTSARTAIITGGSRGIGRNTAVNLARRGVDIVFTYHSNQAEAESLVREVEAIGRKVAAYRLDTGVVAPGAIQTDFSGGMVRDNPDVNKHVADMTALGRAGVPDDIGLMIAALLSEDNRWVNAQRIEVSGGMSI